MEVLKNSSDLKSILSKKGKVLVDFMADWCGPCKSLAPVLEKYSQDNPDIGVISVNADEHMDVATEFNIMNLPTLLLFRDGELVNMAHGGQTAKSLDTFVRG